jgi:hypothetical protein
LSWSSPFNILVSTARTATACYGLLQEALTRVYRTCAEPFRPNVAYPHRSLPRSLRVTPSHHNTIQMRMKVVSRMASSGML